MGPPRRVLPLTRFLRRTGSHFAGKRSGYLKGIGGAGVSCGTLLASIRAVKRFACEESRLPSVVRSSVALLSVALLRRGLGDTFCTSDGAAASPPKPGSAKENDHDVDRHRRRDAAPRAPVLHHAGHGGQEERRARARGGGRHRR